MLRYLLLSVLISFAAAIIVVPAFRRSDFTIDLSNSGTTLPMIKAGDFVIALPSQEIIVMKQDVSGNYSIVSTRNATLASSQLNGLSTDGSWICVSQNLQQQLFKLNTNGAIGEPYNIAVNSSSNTGRIMSDGSYVLMTTDAIYTYTFSESDGWTAQSADTPDRYEDILTPTQNHGFFVGDDYALVVLSDKVNQQIANTTLLIYTRTNQSWTFDGSYSTGPVGGVNSLALDRNSSTLYFGAARLDQTLLSAGTLFVVKKINNQWQQIQSLQGNDVGVIGIGYLGFQLSIVDSETLLASAPYDSVISESNFNGGAIAILQRNESGLLTPLAVARSALKTGLYGLSFLATGNNNVLAFDCKVDLTSGDFTCYLNDIEACYLEPTDVTCHDSNVGSCNSFDLDITQLYTSNTPDNCGSLTAQYTDIRSNAENTFDVDLKFTRTSHTDVTCTVKVTCNGDKQVSSASSAFLGYVVMLICAITANL